MRLLVAVLLSAVLLAAPAPAQEAGEDGYAKGLELFRAGRYEASLPFFQRALDLAEARYGADDPAIAVELNNLAEVHRLTNRLDRAEDLYRRAIDLDTRAGRENDPGYATSLNNLALVYRAQDRLAEAERLYVRSLDLLERTLGRQHPDVARSLNNLAMLYRLEGKPDQARPMQERALATAETALGKRHPTTELLRRNLAALDQPPQQPPRAKPRAVAADDGVAPAPAADRPARVEGPAPGRVAARPSAPEASPASVEPAASGAFTVQVAAIRERDGAAAELRRLTRRFPVLTGLEALPAEQVEVKGKGTFYRVFAGAFAAKADADAVCAQLLAKGFYCRTLRR